MATDQTPASQELIDDLVIANKILYQHDIVDAFGHVSVRHDKDPSKYLMSRYVPPGMVTEEDIVTFDLDSTARTHTNAKFYSERYIHGEVYKARPDVNAVLHCHAPALIPFGVTKYPLRPMYHMSGFPGCGGSGVPIFEIRDTAGMTDLLVRTPELGKALADSLQDRPMVLMRGHGATIVAKTLKLVVYRGIYAVENAALQMEAIKLGEPVYLSNEEADRTDEMAERVIERLWSLWRCEALGEF